jgi:hypothetical protein
LKVRQYMIVVIEVIAFADCIDRYLGLPCSSF